MRSGVRIFASDGRRVVILTRGDGGNLYGVADNASGALLSCGALAILSALPVKFVCAGHLRAVTNLIRRTQLGCLCLSLTHGVVNAGKMPWRVAHDAPS